MSITQRPKPSAKVPPAIDVPAIDVEALINKGGSVGAGAAGRGAGGEDKPTSPVVLRLPARMLQRIERALASRPLRTPRHTWLLEAVLEKLEREEAEEP